MSVEPQSLGGSTLFSGRGQIVSFEYNHSAGLLSQQQNPRSNMEALEESELEMDTEVLFGEVYAIGQPVRCLTFHPTYQGTQTHPMLKDWRRISCQNPQSTEPHNRRSILSEENHSERPPPFRFCCTV